MKKARGVTSLLVIILLVAVFGYLAIYGLQVGKFILLPVSQGIPQGLDLKGGVSSVYEAKDTGVEDFAAKLSSAMEILRNRLDAKGYTEATISKQGENRIRIEIPDVENPDAVLSIIGKPALLQFVDPEGNVILEGSEVESAKPGYLSGAGGAPIVSLKFKSEGAKAFADATANNIGRRISIVLDGKEISSPEVKSAIPNGECYIENIGSIDEAQELAMLIQSGALPLELEQLEIRTISATLGVDALNGSLLAGLIGVAVLFLFMIVYYRLSGLIADFALIIYILIVVYLLAILNVQLTLPGIAGIILSIGMAVDANVIIFERMKEELRAGKTLRAALDSGFKKALLTIIDSNVTTLIAAFVLMIFGTGPIKGFAYTLTIGILVSMFTALTVTRFLMRCLIALNVKSPKLYFGNLKVRDEKKSYLPVIKNSKLFAALSIAVILSGVGFFAFSGINLGIDFQGGTIMTVEMGKTYNMDDVKQIVEKYYTGDTLVSTSDDTKAVIRIQDKDEDPEQQNITRQNLTDELTATYPNAVVESTDRVGAVAGAELVSKAVFAVLAACACMLIYIWWRFELLSGFAAVVALVHDVAIMLAMVIIFKVPVNSSFIAAVLTIVGYSINDTIVVFDRVRENQKRFGSTLDRSAVVDKSITETVSRTLNTSLTTLFTITALYILGVASIKEFALPILVGLISGTYSSVFIASPLWMACHSLIDKKKAKKRA